MNDPAPLYVSVPVASFRVPHAREYLETFPCPAPATVYGMLLSMVGEPNRVVHEGAELAIALLGPAPRRSLVLRTVWRVKNRDDPPGLSENRRPDFQELLTGLKLAIWVRKGEKEATLPPLAERLHMVMERPATANRFGGLALGESTHLVDEIRSWRKEDGIDCYMLTNSSAGSLTLPVWPDHIGSKNTRWGHYKMEECLVTQPPPPEAWTQILKL